MIKRTVGGRISDAINDLSEHQRLRDQHCALADAWSAHAPDLVLYQAGVNALHTDRLGRLKMTHAGLAEGDRRVFAWIEERLLPVVIALGEGYGQPIETTVEAHTQVWRGAVAARQRRPPASLPATR